jgi:hypothetical protein
MPLDTIRMVWLLQVYSAGGGEVTMVSSEP